MTSNSLKAPGVVFTSTRSPTFTLEEGFATEPLILTDPRTQACLAKERVLNIRTAQSQRSTRPEFGGIDLLTNLRSDVGHEFTKSLKSTIDATPGNRIDQNMGDTDVLDSANSVDHLVCGTS